MRILQRMLPKLIFFLALIFILTPWASPPIALAIYYRRESRRGPGVRQATHSEAGSNSPDEESVRCTSPTNYFIDFTCATS